MAAVAAAFDVAAEGRSATAFDRSHGVPPCRGQHRAMLLAKGWTEAAEHIRHFQSLNGHGRMSGGHEIRGGRGHAP